MREATGGALLLYLILPMIFLFIVFIGFIMNYASAYRAANYIVTQIETCDGTLGSDCGHSTIGAATQTVEEKYHYYGPINICCNPMGDGAMFRAELELSIELPMIGSISGFKIVSESKTLHNVTCNIQCAK